MLNISKIPVLISTIIYLKKHTKKVHSIAPSKRVNHYYLRQLLHQALQDISCIRVHFNCI